MKYRPQQVGGEGCDLNSDTADTCLSHALLHSNLASKKYPTPVDDGQGKKSGFSAMDTRLKALPSSKPKKVYPPKSKLDEGGREKAP
eukprot:scaffold17647_cov68-Cyclotella_meneghiniana.AAC.13